MTSASSCLSRSGRRAAAICALAALSLHPAGALLAQTAEPAGGMTGAKAAQDIATDAAGSTLPDLSASLPPNLPETTAPAGKSPKVAIGAGASGAGMPAIFATFANGVTLQPHVPYWAPSGFRP
ncbi:hypothetical protein [Paracoccus cavernae]